MNRINISKNNKILLGSVTYGYRKLLLIKELKIYQEIELKKEGKMQKDWKRVFDQLEKGIKVQRKTIMYCQTKETVYGEKLQKLQQLLQTLESSLSYYTTIKTSIEILEVPSDANSKYYWFNILKKLNKTIKFITIASSVCAKRLQENQTRYTELKEMKNTLENCSEYYQGISNALKTVRREDNLVN